MPILAKEDRCMCPTLYKDFKKPHSPNRQKKPRQNDMQETRDQEQPCKPPSISQELQEIANFGLPSDLGNFKFRVELVHFILPS